jgi:hypothetical protein
VLKFESGELGSRVTSMHEPSEIVAGSARGTLNSTSNTTHQQARRTSPDSAHDATIATISMSVDVPTFSLGMHVELVRRNAPVLQNPSS